MHAPYISFLRAPGGATIDVRIEDVDTGIEESGPGCPDCDCRLDFSQPDADNPDRLIGLCFACGASFLVSRSPTSEDDDWSTHVVERIGSRNADPVRMDPALGVL